MPLFDDLYKKLHGNLVFIIEMFVGRDSAAEEPDIECGGAGSLNFDKALSMVVSGEVMERDLR